MTLETTGRNYAVALVFESSINDEPVVFEEDIVLIEASSTEEAKEKAIHHAKSAGENSYKNRDGETVVVKFKTLAGACPIDEITPGCTLYSRFFKTYNTYAAFQPLLGGESL